MTTQQQYSVDIVPENAAEFRIYVVQYWSQRRNDRVREYADAIPESDLVLMRPQDRQKVLRYARENLGLHAETDEPTYSPVDATPPRAPTSCASCHSPCSGEQKPS